VVVVYKVDRLTRSLADFAKLVELFDANGVSFVSVTQQFNTTTSMGRLTLNVLLSFAQFEREVTGERIRDKIAASKAKGMWMGGPTPMGYRPHERTLRVDEVQAERVREIFRLYLSLGSVRMLKDELDRRGWKTPVRERREGSEVVRLGGDRPFARGHLYNLLGNAIYIGQIPHKGRCFPGLHPGIVDLELWRAVQDRLAANLKGKRNRTNAADPSLLTGFAFDERGIRIQPSHTGRKGRRYRYYFRPAEGDRPAMRMPAQGLEAAVITALTRLLRDRPRLLMQLDGSDARIAQQTLDAAAALAKTIEDGLTPQRIEILRDLEAGVVVGEDRVEVTIRIDQLGLEAGQTRSEQPVLATTAVAVQRRRAHKAIKLVVKGADHSDAGPNPKLVNLLIKSQRWFDQLKAGYSPGVLSIANEHGLTTKEVTRVVYLAFLAPDIVQRIAEGTEPVGLAMKHLLDAAPLPLAWDEQRRVLGFES